MYILACLICQLLLLRLGVYQSVRLHTGDLSWDCPGAQRISAKLPAELEVRGYFDCRWTAGGERSVIPVDQPMLDKIRLRFGDVGFLPAAYWLCQGLSITTPLIRWYGACLGYWGVTASVHLIGKLSAVSMLSSVQLPVRFYNFSSSKCWRRKLCVHTTSSQRS